MKKFLLFLTSLILSLLIASFAGKFYFYLFPTEKGGGIFSLPIDATNLLRGFTPSYFLSLILLLTAFGGAKKYWWIGILLIPAGIAEVYLDVSHIYFPLALGLLGWGIGLGISKFLSLRAKRGNLSK